MVFSPLRGFGGGTGQHPLTKSGPTVSFPASKSVGDRAVWAFRW